MSLKNEEFLFVDTALDVCAHYKITDDKPKVETIQLGDDMNFTTECFKALNEKYKGETEFVVLPFSEVLKWRADYESKHQKDKK